MRKATRSEPHGHTVQKPRTACLFTVHALDALLLDPGCSWQPGGLAVGYRIRPCSIPLHRGSTRDSRPFGLLHVAGSRSTGVPAPGDDGRNAPHRFPMTCFDEHARSAHPLSRTRVSTGLLSTGSPSVDASLRTGVSQTAFRGCGRPLRKAATDERLASRRPTLHDNVRAIRVAAQDPPQVPFDNLFHWMLARHGWPFRTSLHRVSARGL